LASFETGAATHVGNVRERNEDRFLCKPETLIWAVADGMGGHDAGDLASQIIVECLSAIEAPSSASELLLQCEQQIVQANERLREISRKRGGAVLGATIAVLLAYERHYACIWSGDSRIYVARAGAIEQLSRDHTEVQQLLADGAITAEEAKNWPQSNVVTRAIGVFDWPELEVSSGALEPGDSFLLCSDGLTQHVTDEELLEHVSSGTPQQACDALIALTLQRGARDNVTVIVVRYHPNSEGSRRQPAGPPDLWEAPR